MNSLVKLIYFVNIAKFGFVYRNDIEYFYFMVYDQGKMRYMLKYNFWNDDFKILEDFLGIK